MSRILGLIAVAALVAGPASARDFHIKIAGRSDAAVQQDIRVAAQRMCDSSQHGISIRALEPQRSCFKFAVTDGDAQLTQAHVQAQAKTANVRVAAAQ